MSQDKNNTSKDEYTPTSFSVKKGQTGKSVRDAKIY